MPAKRKYPRLCKQQEHRVVLLYENGHSSNEIAKLFGTYPVAISQILKKHNVAIRSHPSTILKNEEAEAIVLYKQGFTCDWIGKFLGYGLNVIWRCLLRNGIAIQGGPRMRPRLGLNESRFTILDEQACYWLGFIVGDGCITIRENSSPALSVGIFSKDHNHLCAFRAFLSSQHKISISKRKNHTKMSQIAIRSKMLCDSIQSLLGNPFRSEISPVLIKNRHFWRGLVDADGSVYLQNQKYLRMNLAGHKNFLDSFAEFLKLHHIKPGKITRMLQTRATYLMWLSGQSAISTAKLLYTDSTIALERKKVTAIQTPKNRTVYGRETLEFQILPNGDLRVVNPKPSHEGMLAELGTRKDSHSLYCG